MSPRTRLLEILNAADLAKLQDAQAAQQAQASAANTGQWINALQALPSVVGSGIGSYQKGIADDASVAAKQAIADNMGARGAYAQQPVEGPQTEEQAASGLGVTGPDPTKYAGTAGEFAKQAVAGNADLQAPKPKGILDNVMSFLGDNAGATAKARADASTGIASEVQKNRDAFTAQQRQQELDRQNAAKNDAEMANLSASTAKTTADIGDVAAQQKQREAANAKAAKDEAVRAAVAQGIAKGRGLGGRISPLASILLNNPDLNEGDLAAEFQRQTGTELDAAAKRSLEQANAAEAWGRASQANAAAKNTANGKPLEEGARKAIADMQTQLGTIDDLKAKKGDVDTGRLSAFQNTLAQALGIDDPTKTQFRAESAQLRDQIMHELSGSAISAPEMARIIEGIPSFTDSDSAYESKLKATRDSIARALGNRVNVEHASGANTSGIVVPASPRPTSGPGSNPF